MSESAILESAAALAAKDQIYILGPDPHGVIARAFPDHPGWCYVVRWMHQIDEHTTLKGYLNVDEKFHEDDGSPLDEQDAIFGNREDAEKAAAAALNTPSFGAVMIMKYEVGQLAPPKGGQ